MRAAGIDVTTLTRRLGLLQCPAQISKGFDVDPQQQAVAVHNIYTGDDPNYGCLSSHCQATDCHLPVENIGQDESVISHHRFCKGTWTHSNDHFAHRLKAVGGLDAVKNACSTAAVKGGLRETVKKMSVSPVVAAKKTAKALSEEASCPAAVFNPAHTHGPSLRGRVGPRLCLHPRAPLCCSRTLAASRCCRRSTFWSI